MGNSLQKPSENQENLRGENKEEEEENNAIPTCQICIEPMSVNKKIKNNNDLCTHQFCEDCIAKYIEVKVQDDSTAKIECPGIDCQQLLDPHSCRPMIPPSLFVKWCDLLCGNYVLGFERSYCPNNNCTALIVSECGSEVKKAQCPNCKQWLCFKCKSAWHAGYRCEESGKWRDPNDILFGKLAEDMNWARCPGCGHSIERRDGCNNITCRSCKTFFCYGCGGKYPSGCSCNRKYFELCCIICCSLILLIVLGGVIFGISYAVYRRIHSH